MSNDNIQKVLEELGITSQEIEEAGGVEAIAHIVWFFQQTDTYSDDEIDDAINHAIAKKKQEDILKKAFDDSCFYGVSSPKDDNDIIDKPHILNQTIIRHPVHIPLENNDKDFTIKEIYEKHWGSNPHPALQLLVQAFFLEMEDMIPNADDKKEVLRTVSLFRAYIAGAKLPDDAEDEQMIAHARNMYKEFLETKQDYDNCPMVFLLDDYSDQLPEKYRMIVQRMPVPAILKIFVDNCFYDTELACVDEPLPEEINIKKLCDMIETLARIFKIWQ